MRVLLHTHVMKVKKTSLNYFGEAGVAVGACGFTPAFLEEFTAGAALDLLEAGSGY